MLLNAATQANMVAIILQNRVAFGVIEGRQVNCPFGEMWLAQWTMYAHCSNRRLRLRSYPNMPLMPLGILPEDICFIIFCIWRN